MQDSLSITELRDVIVNTLEEYKAEDIAVIDLKGKTDIADFMIIATGKSSKHVASTAEFVIGKIKENDSPYIVEGQNSDWVLVDTMDIITHIFTKDTRELYDLEQLWQHRK
jgi:ribosome-associated protein